jgi:hypothetical protein
MHLRQPVAFIDVEVGMGVAVVVVYVVVVVVVRRGGGGGINGGGALAMLMTQPHALSCTAMVSLHCHLLFGTILLSWHSKNLKKKNIS